MSWKRKLLIVPPLAIGVAVLVTNVVLKKAPVQEAPREISRAVRVLSVPEVSVIPRALGFGEVKPRRVWNAVAKVAGTAVFVHPELRRGAIIPEGTELIVIDPTDYQLVIARIEADKRATQARIVELDVSRTNTEASLEIEKRALVLKEKDLARKRKLVKTGAASVAATDAAQRDALSQRQQVQNLQNSLNLIPTQRVVLQEQMAVYQAQQDEAKHDLARTKIVAPFAGRVAEANVETSQYVQSGQVVTVLDSIDSSEVEAQIAIDQFSNVVMAAASKWKAPRPEQFNALLDNMGIKATVRLKSGNLSYEWVGKVVRVSDTVDPKTRTVGVIVSVANTYKTAVPGERPPLVKGMFVEVEFSGQPLPSTFIVPRTAVNNGQVYVADTDNRLQIKPVKILFAQSGFVAVSQGLKAGDRIVLSDVVPAVAGLLLVPVVDTAAQAALIAAARGEGDVK